MTKDDCKFATVATPAADTSRDLEIYKAKPLPAKIKSSMLFAILSEVSKDLFRVGKNTTIATCRYTWKIIKSIPGFLFFECIPPLILFSLLILPGIAWFTMNLEAHHGSGCSNPCRQDIYDCSFGYGCWALTPRMAWRRFWTNWWKSVKSRAEKKLLDA